MSTRHTPHPRRFHGFTLIELLVVVAIIAALIGILLPSLGAARADGIKVVCMAKIREIMKASLMYAAANERTLPRMYWDTNGGSSWNQSYSDLIFPYLDSNVGDDNHNGKINAKYYQEKDFFICPAEQVFATTARNNQVLHYGMNNYGRKNDSQQSVTDRYWPTINARQTNEVANSDAIVFSDADSTNGPEDIGGGTRSAGNFVWPLNNSINEGAAVRHRLGYNVAHLDSSVAWLPGEAPAFEKWWIRKFFVEKNY
ncbi:MAG: prepilin-type N-terminal cleavage/methylation domain-containing protein [Phycisphaera sp.]|nr:prepilin-type N-terminal cleavage/methylation domain-containing protein [Phycisphaera sp.]